MKNITGYGNFLWANTKPTSAIRHKLYKRFNFRCVISPQYYSPSLVKPLALHGYGLDNGAFIAHKKKEFFPHDKFFKMVKSWGCGADFIVIPDIVENAKQTISISWLYISQLVKMGFGKKLLFCYQDGMNASHLHPYIAQGIGIFIGGSTEAKMKAIPWISSLCRKFGVWCHVGRVNTMNRVQRCIDYGCSSFDGSGWTMFPNTFTRIQTIEDNLQISLFQHEKNTSLLSSLEHRTKSLGLSISEILEYWETIKRTNTKGVGLPKKYTKKEKTLLEL